MQFIEPFLLWGALAVAIPVAIHFWHQKQGKLLPWAATQWLIEKQQLQSRGLRLDNILLLILRCLLLILLAILLAQPMLDWLKQPPVIQKVHLVQPSRVVTDNYKFELSDAIKKGEKVIWADDKAEAVTEQLTPLRTAVPFHTLRLQTNINRLDLKNTELHLYLVNSQKLATVPAITVSAQYRLHTVVDSASQPRPYLVVKNGRKLFINKAGKLTSAPALDPTLKFQMAPAHSGPVHVLIDYRNEQERQTVKAALGALSDVFAFDLAIDEKPVSTRTYDWLLTDKVPLRPSPQSLYIVSGAEEINGAATVYFTNETLTPQTSNRVATGQLPEWLGAKLLHHYGFTTNGYPLSQKDLQSIFIATNKPTIEQHAGIQNALLLVFVVVLAVERWLALTKNA